MPKPKVKHVLFSDDQILAVIRECAADSDRLFWSAHAREQMGKRGITSRQVLNCLAEGNVTEPVHRTVKGDWKCMLTHVTAGVVVDVVIAVDMEPKPPTSVVVTAIV